MLKRIVYLGYYFKKLDREKYDKFSTYVINNYQISRVRLFIDVVLCSLKYNISLLDYFYFKFYELEPIQRKEFAGTGYMFEYQLQMNPKQKREILENKLLFLEKYSKFISHEYSSKKDFLSNEKKAATLLANKSRKIVLKSSDGQCGEGIEVINLDNFTNDDFYKLLNKSNNDLIEEYIVQHDELMKLSPSGLNTVRIFTQLNGKNEVDILGARLRITINSNVDNLAAGNIAATINEKLGVVNGRGVYSDITKFDEEIHPITGTKILDFQVPYWKESLHMAKEAALLFPENRSIGWDVAITNSGPELLEGNHNWCKLLWQLPIKKGLKNKLEQYR